MRDFKIMDEDEYNDIDIVRLGCMDCGSIFEYADLYGGRCPICNGHQVTTFEDLLGYVMEHREYMETLGLLDEGS